jgi:uncharacterized surface protein with fasciclin (FAS1) repeats
VVDVPIEPSKILKEGGLTRFLEALKEQGLEKKLDDTKGLTIFAPVNAAFDVPKCRLKRRLLVDVSILYC